VGCGTGRSGWRLPLDEVAAGGGRQEGAAPRPWRRWVGISGQGETVRRVTGEGVRLRRQEGKTNREGLQGWGHMSGH
jgi:hypothetical protein